MNDLSRQLAAIDELQQALLRERGETLRLRKTIRGLEAALRAAELQRDAALRIAVWSGPPRQVPAGTRESG